MTSLRELVETAQSQIETYKNPETGEVEKRLTEILEAGKLGSLKHEALEGLWFYKGMLRSNTAYSCRGCSMSGDYELPEAVIDADDPIAAIKVWAKEQRVAKAQAEVNEAERTLNWRREALTKVQQEEL